MKSKKPDDDDDGEYVGVTGGVSKRRISRETMNKLLGRKPEETPAKVPVQPAPPPVRQSPPARLPPRAYLPDDAARLVIRQKTVAARAARHKAEAERRAQHKPGFDDLLSFVNKPNVSPVFSALVRERMPVGMTISEASVVLGYTSRGVLINIMRGERPWTGPRLKSMITWLGGSDVEWLAETRKRRMREVIKAKRTR